MGCWGGCLLLLAMVSVSHAQLKRQRFRALDPVRGERPHFPGARAGGRWFPSWNRDYSFSLPMLALLVGLSGSVALYVLHFRRPVGAPLGSEPDGQTEEVFLHDVLTVLSIIRNRLSQIVQERQEPQISPHKSKVEDLETQHPDHRARNAGRRELYGEKVRAEGE